MSTNADLSYWEVPNSALTTDVPFFSFRWAVFGPSALAES